MPGAHQGTLGGDGSARDGRGGWAGGPRAHPWLGELPGVASPQSCSPERSPLLGLGHRVPAVQSLGIWPEHPLALAVGVSLSFGPGVGGTVSPGLCLSGSPCCSFLERSLAVARLSPALSPPLALAAGCPIPWLPWFHWCLLAAASSGSLLCPCSLQQHLWDTGSASQGFSSSRVVGLWQHPMVLSGEGHSIPVVCVPSWGQLQQDLSPGCPPLTPSVVGTVLGSVPSCVLQHPLAMRGWLWLLPVSPLGKQGSQFPQ